MRLTRDDLLLAAQGRAARLAVNLPGVPSGRAGRTLVDGQGVDRQVATLIAVEAKLQRPGKILSLDEQRESFRSSAKIAAGTPIKVGPIRDLTVTGAAGHLKARHYTPPTLGIGRPLLVFFHGGGWVKGDLDSHDQPCRLLARQNAASARASVVPVACAKSRTASCTPGPSASRSIWFSSSRRVAKKSYSAIV